MRKSWKLGGALVIVAAAGIAGAVRAYTISTNFTKGCHEKITSQAFRTARAALAIPPTPPVTDDERALIGDLQFEPDGDMKDLAGATLLIAARDNDLRGASSDDLTILAEIHGDPTTQRDHCLRSPGQKEPGGSAAAVADCQAYIRERVLQALDGLDAAGVPDLSKRVSLSVHLALRGHVDASLPLYYVRMGQALHAVQDSFSHTYRTPDGTKITVALDWLDSVNQTLVESRDGPSHATALDVCDDPDDLRKTKRALATEASTEILSATLDPLKTPAAKVAAVDAILVTYVSYQPGCTFDNGWCNAPERQYKDSGKNVLGCNAAGAGREGGGASWGLVVLILLAMAIRARRRRLGATLMTALVIAGSALVAGNARAQTGAAKPESAPPTATSSTTQTPAKAATSTAPATAATVTTTTTTTQPATGDTHAPPAPTIVPVKEPGPTDPGKMAFGGYLGWSGSINQPAMALQLGARLKVSKHWTFGLDFEANPWISSTNTKIRRGVNNYYGTVILRFPLAYENFNLATTLNVGISQLMMNLYGAPKGSIGLFAGISPLGLEWKLSRLFILIINPLNYAIPVPQLKGVPLDYPQYRFSIGLGVLTG